MVESEVPEEQVPVLWAGRTAGGPLMRYPNPAAARFYCPTLGETSSLLLLLSKDPHGWVTESSSATQAVINSDECCSQLPTAGPAPGTALGVISLAPQPWEGVLYFPHNADEDTEIQKY